MRRYGAMALSGRRRAAARLSQSGAARMLLLVVGLVPLLLAGCSAQQVDAVPLAKSQVFTWPYTGGAKVNYDEVLDPAVLSALADSGTINMLYVGLVSFNSNASTGSLQVQPDAAKSWDIDQTGKVYTFHLRPNMKFSDDTPLTAKDFAYSINRALDPTICTSLDVVYGDNGSGVCVPNGQTYLNHILGATAKINAPSGSGPSLIGDGTDKGLTVVDPLTLIIRLDAPIPYFLQALTYPTSYAVEQSLVENPQYAGGRWVDHLDQAGCSGPFKVSSYGGGTQLTLVPNPNWEDAWEMPLTLTKVVRPVIASPDDAYNDYVKGSYDEADVPLGKYTTAKSQNDFHDLPTLTTRYFGLNVQKAPFADTGKVFVKVDGEANPIDVGEALRRAFALELNKQGIVDGVTQGAGSPTNHIIPRGMPGYYPDLRNPMPDGTLAVTGNQPKARTLMDQVRATCPSFVDADHAYCRYITGSNLKPIVLHMRNNNDTQLQIAHDFAAQWNADLGVNVSAPASRAQADDPRQFIKTVYTVPPQSPDAFQIWGLGWAADYTDPQDWLSVFFATGAPNNTFGLSDPSLDTLLAKADVEQDPNKRIALYNQAEQIVVDKVIWIPYEQEKFQWSLRPWVRGFGFNPLLLVPDVNWHLVSILQH